MMLLQALDIGLAILVFAVAALTIFARGAFAATVGYVVYGLLLALVWIRLFAVDVALTEAAIGSGVTPTHDQIEEVHGAIRQALDARWSGAPAPILYGGSVKPDNAAEILRLAEVGGALVGGASLTAAQFVPIVRAA